MMLFEKDSHARRERMRRRVVSDQTFYSIRGGLSFFLQIPRSSSSTFHSPLFPSRKDGSLTKVGLDLSFVEAWGENLGKSQTAMNKRLVCKPAMQILNRQHSSLAWHCFLFHPLFKQYLLFLQSNYDKLVVLDF